MTSCQKLILSYSIDSVRTKITFVDGNDFVDQNKLCRTEFNSVRTLGTWNRTESTAMSTGIIYVYRNEICRN